MSKSLSLATQLLLLALAFAAAALIDQKIGHHITANVGQTVIFIVFLHRFWISRDPDLEDAGYKFAAWLLIAMCSSAIAYNVWDVAISIAQMTR